METKNISAIHKTKELASHVSTVNEKNIPVQPKITRTKDIFASDKATKSCNDLKPYSPRANNHGSLAGYTTSNKSNSLTSLKTMKKSGSAINSKRKTSGLIQAKPDNSKQYSETKSLATKPQQRVNLYAKHKEVGNVKESTLVPTNKNNAGTTLSSNKKPEPAAKPLQSSELCSPESRAKPLQSSELCSPESRAKPLQTLESCSPESKVIEHQNDSVVATSSLENQSYESFIPFSTDSESNISINHASRYLSKQMHVNHKILGEQTPTNLVYYPTETSNSSNKLVEQFESFILDCDSIIGSGSTIKNSNPTPESLTETPEFNYSQNLNQGLYSKTSLLKASQNKNPNSNSKSHYIGYADRKIIDNCGKGLGVLVPTEAQVDGNAAFGVSSVNKNQSIDQLETALEYGKILVKIIQDSELQKGQKELPVVQDRDCNRAPKPGSEFSEQYFDTVTKPKDPNTGIDPSAENNLSTGSIKDSSILIKKTKKLPEICKESQLLSKTSNDIEPSTLNPSENKSSPDNISLQHQQNEYLMGAVKELIERLGANGLDTNTKYDSMIFADTRASTNTQTPNITSVVYNKPNSNSVNSIKNYQEFDKNITNLSMKYTNMIKESQESNTEISKLTSALKAQKLENAKLKKKLRYKTGIELSKFKRHFDRLYAKIEHKIPNSNDDATKSAKKQNKISNLDSQHYLKKYAPKNPSPLMNKIKKFKSQKYVIKAFESAENKETSDYIDTDSYEEQESVECALSRSVSANKYVLSNVSPNNKTFKRNNTVSNCQDFTTKEKSIDNTGNSAKCADSTLDLNQVIHNNQSKKKYASSIIEALDQDNYNYKSISIDLKAASYSREVMAAKNSINKKLSLKLSQNRQISPTRSTVATIQHQNSMPSIKVTEKKSSMVLVNKYARPYSKMLIKTPIKKTSYSVPLNTLKTVPSTTNFNEGEQTSTGLVKNSPNPELVKYIAKAMIGEYIDLVGFSPDSLQEMKKELFYFWLHPYAKTLYWSKEPPRTPHLNNGKLDARTMRYSKDLKSFINLKSGDSIKASGILFDSKHSNNETHPNSIYIDRVSLVSCFDSHERGNNTPKQFIKIKANNQDIMIRPHTPNSCEMWYCVLGYIQSRAMTPTK
ncbi:hypothetical protein BB561_003009 [Smittium simulii]|uniref:Pleckstrin homology domain-containing protein n=1 Tax=Smittium simulii TaxID=133385 RepID=A0A2T9YND4_9FUNG|nr:hypothetical protein BB561_003009 [Smittium simulii]